jgi:hypothetical protein
MANGTLVVMSSCDPVDVEAGGGCLGAFVYNTAFTPTVTPTPTNTAMPTSTATPGPDGDGDGVADAIDNCPTVANAGQENADGNFVDNSPPYASSVDDRTYVVSDAVGDACDDDDDNDGIPDAVETDLVALQGVCPAASATTNPLKIDTDGDRATDGVECRLGTDPASAASRPPAPTAAQDADRDGLSDATEALLGTNPNVRDSDGDGLLDGWEVLGHGSDPLSVDSDGDGATDGCEVASINGDTVVNVGDQALLASEVMRVVVPPAKKLTDFDLNRDGAVNVGDQAFQASKVGGSPAKCRPITPWR